MQDLLPPDGPSRRHRFLRGARDRFVRDDRAGRRAVKVLVVGLPLVIGVIFLVVAFASRSSSALSGFVQAHGVRREAVILSVQNIADRTTTTNGNSNHPITVTTTSWTALVQVRLADPVDGQTRTTVNVPNYENGHPGDTLTVLVDPDKPGYAELPGEPSSSPLAPTIFLIIGSVIVVAGIALWVLIARKGTGFINRPPRWRYHRSR
jgi:hypothetical protein